MGADWSFFDRGFSVFPLHATTKIPAGLWGRYIYERAGAEQVVQWASSPANMGVATGAVSGIIVLDCDNLLARIECERRGIPATLTVATPRGTHFYFQHPGWEIRNKVGLTWDGWTDLGIDVRGDGGFVVGPGSHYVPSPADIAKGKVDGTYQVEHDGPLAPLPAWLAEHLFPKPHEHVPLVPAQVAEATSPYGRSALHGALSELQDARDGQISHTLYAMTARIAELVAGGEITQEEGWGGLYEILAARGLEDEDKANGTVQRAWAKGLSNPKAAPEREGSSPVAPEIALGVRAPIMPPVVEDIDGDIMFLPDPPDPRPPFTPRNKPRHVNGNNIGQYFAGVTYIANRDQMFLPCGALLGRSAFDAIYGGPGFILDHDADGKPERSAWRMFTNNSQVEMPKAYDICFRPKLPPGQIIELESWPYLNIYVPVRTPRAIGDPGRFIEHVRKMLPNERDADILLHWMASCIQNPGEKFQWWPVVQGVQGNGKTLLIRVMMYAIGERYSHLVRADALLKTGNQFNDWLVGKLFLGFEEIKSSDGKRDFVEIMKDTVTNERLATEGKGAGQKTSDNFANGMMLTNHRGACPIDDAERRWAIFFSAQQTADDLVRDGMDATYFRELYDWLRRGGYAVVAYYLSTMPLDDALDPARGLQRAPGTSTTPEAIEESRGLVEQEVLEAIDEGRIGFRNGWISSFALRALFATMKRTVGSRKYRGIIESIGYIPHPAFLNGRVINPLKDGTRPRLYVRKNSEAANLSHAEAVKAFEIAQTVEIFDAADNVIPFRGR